LTHNIFSSQEFGALNGLEQAVKPVPPPSSVGQRAPTIMLNFLQTARGSSFIRTVLEAAKSGWLAVMAPMSRKSLQWAVLLPERRDGLQMANTLRLTPTRMEIGTSS